MTTFEELKKRLDESGFKYAYNHFEEEVSPPHVVVFEDNSDNFSADNKVFLKIKNVVLILTTEYKEKYLEDKIENEILKDIHYETEEVYVASEKIYNINYFFKIRRK